MAPSCSARCGLPTADWIAYPVTASGGFRADIFISRPDGWDERVQITDTPDNEIVVEWGAGDD